jgi:tripartite-type tricarboxylate transporter receptor subunit TctC
MKTNRRQVLTALAAGAAGLGCVAHAQTLSGRPVKMIVPFAAGGANDLIARALQRPLGEALKTNVIVQNMPGGSTKIATSELMRSAPDGTTLMLAGNVALMSYYYSGIYDKMIWNEMTVLGQTGRMPWGMLETRAESPFKSWADVVAYGKKNPGKLTAGGPALGGMMNLIVIETARTAGIDVVYVPYKGGGPSGLAMLGGEVAYRVAQPPEVFPNVKAGKTRGLGIAYHERLPEMPDVPTFKELGIMFDIPAFGFDVWGPPGMASSLANTITEAVKVAIKDPTYVSVAKRLVYQPEFTTPEDLKKSMRYFEQHVGPKMAAAFPPPKK